MYQRPILTRFGTFRELTLAGVTGSNDGYMRMIDGAVGCGQLGYCS